MDCVQSVTCTYSDGECISDDWVEFLDKFRRGYDSADVAILRDLLEFICEEGTNIWINDHPKYTTQKVGSGGHEQIFIAGEHAVKSHNIQYIKDIMHDD